MPDNSAKTLFQETPGNMRLHHHVIDSNIAGGVPPDEPQGLANTPVHHGGGIGRLPAAHRQGLDPAADASEFPALHQLMQSLGGQITDPLGIDHNAGEGGTA